MKAWHWYGARIPLVPSRLIREIILARDPSEFGIRSVRGAAAEKKKDSKKKEKKGREGEKYARASALANRLRGVALEFE